MVNITKQEVRMEEHLRKRLELICEFCRVKPIIINGNLRTIDKTNLTYLEPHRIIINDITFLAFNYSNEIFIENLNKIMNILPKFIQELIDRLFIRSNIDIKYFKEQYDPDIIEKRNKESKNRKLFNFNNRNYSNDYENDLDYKEKSKNDDDFEL